MSDPRVTVRLPRVLEQVTGGARQFEVRAATLQGALDALVAERPGLGPHLFDEAGIMRRHVLCFCNETYHRGRDGLDVPLRPGDTVTILHSVSGGSG